MVDTSTRLGRSSLSLNAFEIVLLLERTPGKQSRNGCRIRAQHSPPNKEKQRLAKTN